jgi:hypothetical protein
MLLSALVMTPNEQLLLELINRARANPGAEAARLGMGLNDGLPPGTITDTPKQPLAPHQLLINAAQAHSQDMLDRDFFSHTNPSNVTFDQRITNTGYNWVSVGENISWGGVTPHTVPIDQVAHVYARHDSLFRSTTGHRENILEDYFREVGIGVKYGLYTRASNGQTYNSSMVTEDFGRRLGDAFITGVVFDDASDGSADDDSFYTIGEQVGSGTIEATASTGEVYTALIGPSGGYALQVPDGTYTVRAFGGAVGATFVVTNVVVSGQRNVKVDFDTSQTPPPPPPPADVDSLVGRMSDGRVWVARSDGTRFINEHWTTWSTATDWQNVVAGDFNGDGREDLAARNATGDWWVWTAGTSSFTGQSWNLRWSAGVNWSDVLVGDFDGNGQDDIVGRSQSGGWYLARSTGSSFQSVVLASWSTSVTWHDASVGDFNGDGIDDVAARAHTGTWVFLQSTGSGDQHASLVPGAWSNKVTWHHVGVGDFNHDGLDDLAGRASNGAWYVSLSTGTGLTHLSAGSWSTNVTWHDVTIGDFNGDGYADIAGRASTGSWWIIQSNPGAGAGSIVFTRFQAGAWSTALTWVDVVAGDFNGDGRTDIAGRTSTGTWYVSRSTGTGFVNETWGNWSTAVPWDDVLAISVS